MSENTTTPAPLASAPGNEPFANPYAEAGDTSTKLICKITPSDYNFVRCIRPSQGTNTGVIGTLWKKLVNELNKRNIHSIADVNEFERFVANCRIVSYDEGLLLDRLLSDRLLEGSPEPSGIGGVGLSDSTSNGDLSNPVAPVVGHGAKESSASLAPVETERTDVQGGTGTQRRGSRKGKEGKGTSEKSHVE